MKPFILMIALAATSIAACSNPQKSNAQKAEVPPASAQSQNGGLQEVITHYLHLKNALASADANEAATAGGQLHTALTDLGKRSEERRLGKELVSKCRSRWSPKP